MNKIGTLYGRKDVIFILLTNEHVKVIGDYAEITIKSRGGEVQLIAKVDFNDLERVIGKFLVSMSNGYVNIRVDGNSIGLHRYLTSAEDNEQVDHINGDRSDNRKCNLRRCTRSQNFMNKGKQQNNKSGYRGVIWYDYCSVPKWMAYITVCKKRKHLGYFDNIEDAIEARRKAEILYHGEYRTNDERWEVKYW